MFIVLVSSGDHYGRAFGPFKTKAEAERWGEAEYPYSCWDVYEVEAP